MGSGVNPQQQAEVNALTEIRTNVFVDEDLWQLIKMHAAAIRAPAKDVLDTALREYLQNHAGEKRLREYVQFGKGGKGQ